MSYFHNKVFEISKTFLKVILRFHQSSDFETIRKIPSTAPRGMMMHYRTEDGPRYIRRVFKKSLMVLMR